MPELPEVETTLRGILPHIQNQIIMQVVIRNRQLRWPISPQLPQILPDKKILSAKRRGKYLLLQIVQGTLIIHLGMSGSLRVLPEGYPHNKHDHVDIIFRNQKILRFTDPRRFGALLWTEENPASHPLLKNLGIEPLTRGFTGKYLWLHAQSRHVPIKILLMDNHVVTGIGNIYANEALFVAGIHPAAAANSLSAERLQLLVKAVKQILRHAIQRGGTTLKDFTNSEGKPGYFADQLKVYGRAGLACVRCHAPLQFLRIGQRSTVYCQHCQLLD